MAVIRNEFYDNLIFFDMFGLSAVQPVLFAEFVVEWIKSGLPCRTNWIGLSSSNAIQWKSSFHLSNIRRMCGGVVAVLLLANHNYSLSLSLSHSLSHSISLNSGWTHLKCELFWHFVRFGWFWRICAEQAFQPHFACHWEKAHPFYQS